MKVYTATLTNSQTKEIHADGYVRVDRKLLFHQFGGGVVAVFKETDVWRVEVMQDSAKQVPQRKMEA